jgi:hypothetical protein
MIPCRCEDQVCKVNSTGLRDEHQRNEELRAEKIMSR